MTVSSVDLARTLDTSITLSDDFIRPVTAATMFVTGRVKVKGEYPPEVRLSGYFDIPKPTDAQPKLAQS